MKRKLKATEGGWTEYVSNVEVLRDKYLESERQFVFFETRKEGLEIFTLRGHGEWKQQVTYLTSWCK